MRIQVQNGSHKSYLEKQIWQQQYVTPLAGMFDQDILQQLQVLAGKRKVSRN